MATITTTTDAGRGEAKHTPGPWKLPFDGKGSAWQESKYPFLWTSSVTTRPVTRDDGQCCAVLGHKCYGETQDEALANARLIAAAPDLLAACEAALPYLQEAWKRDGIGGQFEMMDALRNAIASAKGGAA